MHKIKLNAAISFTVSGIAVLLEIFPGSSAFGATIFYNAPLTVRNETIGQISLFSREGRNEGMAASLSINKPDWKTFLGLGATGQLNWFQIILEDTTPPLKPDRTRPTAPFIDPPLGGYIYRGADDAPWYYDKEPPKAPYTILPWDTTSLIQNYTYPNGLYFEDIPNSIGVRKMRFETFLVADFGNKTYDTLFGFSWSLIASSDGSSTIPKETVKTGVTFTQDYAKRIKSEFGYSKILRLPNYTYKTNLSPGEVETFQIPGLAPNTPFFAWTDNLPSLNPPGKPDTILGLFHQLGYLTNYNDNGGPRTTNLASGLKESVKNPNGSINIKVTGYGDFNFDGKLDYTNNPHCQSGNYNLHVKLYDENFPTGGITNLNTSCPPVCTGGSGGGGCVTATALQTAYRAVSLFDTESKDDSEELTKVPEPPFGLGLLALGIWGVFQVRKIRKIKYL